MKNVVPEQENQLHPDLLGVLANNPWPGSDSSSRQVMANSHIGQALVVKGATPRRCRTGIEREYGRYTFSIKMPCDATIVRVIRKYPPILGGRNLGNSPVTTVIYEDESSPHPQINSIDLVHYHWLHQSYGFRYVYRPIVERLAPGAKISKGTIIADSPAVQEDGEYCYGKETNIALMSYHSVIEDGVVVSKSFLDKMTATAFGARNVMWGKKYYPLNLYGDRDNYKPFPDIGDHIREDGLVFAMRRYDEFLAPCLMTPSALMEVDYVFDKTVYATPGARVIDINVYKGSQGKSNMPSGMTEQTDRYYYQTKSYYDNVLREYNLLRRGRSEEIRIGPEFHRLVVESMAYNDTGTGDKVHKLINRNPLDEWSVHLTFENEHRPTIGSKITDLHGGKAVIVDIFDDEDMPVNERGDRAEVIMDADSTIKRMNLGRIMEHYINASAMEVRRNVAEMVVKPTEKNYERAWKYLTGFYKIVSPYMYEALMVCGTAQHKKEHIDDIIADDIYLWIPTNNPAENVDIIGSLLNKYPAHNGPVKYRGSSGTEVTTVSNIIIGSMYFILLEKMGDTWSAVSSAKLQHFGIPAKVTNADKYAVPARTQPVRVFGETEVRLIAAACGGDVVAEIMDQSNNPVAHRHVVENILSAPQPMNIDNVVDRTLVPRGNSRPLIYVKHILECAGVRFTEGSDED